MKFETKGQKRNLIYLMGSSYSGSTLLTCILAKHPEISTLGELKATAMGEISTYKCGCGELLTNCEYWHTIACEMKKAGRKFEFDNFGTHFQAASWLKNKLLGAGFRGKYFEYAREIGFYILKKARVLKESIITQNNLIIEIVCRLHGGSCFLDGSKDPVRIMHFLQADLWNIKVIYLIRDGRGVTNSYMTHHDTSMDFAVREWVYAQKECDRMVKTLGDKCLTINYENFCANPQVTLAEIYSFCELDSNFTESVQLDHILGNNMRLKPLTEIKLDEKWKTKLSPGDLETFAKHADSLNRSYGYE